MHSKLYGIGDLLKISMIALWSIHFKATPSTHRKLSSAEKIHIFPTLAKSFNFHIHVCCNCINPKKLKLKWLIYLAQRKGQNIMPANISAWGMG